MFPTGKYGMFRFDMFLLSLTTVLLNPTDKEQKVKGYRWQME